MLVGCLLLASTRGSGQEQVASVVLPAGFDSASQIIQLQVDDDGCIVVQLARNIQYSSKLGFLTQTQIGFGLVLSLEVFALQRSGHARWLEDWPNHCPDWLCLNPRTNGRRYE